MDYFLNGQKISVQDSDRLSSGREAVIYKYKNQALKVYIEETSPLLAKDPLEQKAAHERLIELPLRLKAYPDLGPNYVNPNGNLTNASQKTLGYAMPLLKDAVQLIFYLKADFIAKGITWDIRKKLFVDLWSAVKTAHSKQVILGDGMSPRNFMVDKKHKVWGIDTLAYQYANFYCMMLTDSVVDPLLLVPGKLDLAKPYDYAADIYSFYVLAFEALTHVNPYSGMLPNKVKQARQITSRRDKRITVFDAEVKYPSDLPHWSIIPDELLNHFFSTFVHDRREDFPMSLWENLVWGTCPKCGTTHARSTCPQCTLAPVPAVVSKTQVTKQLTATMLYQTLDRILYAQSDKQFNLKFLTTNTTSELNYSANGWEKPLKLPGQSLKPNAKYRFHKTWIVGYDEQLYFNSVNTRVDRFENTLAFDANDYFVYWIKDGYLYKNNHFNGQLLPELVHNKQLVENNTGIWVSSTQGCGLVRTSIGDSLFIFNAKLGNNFRNVLHNSRTLFRLQGALLDSQVVFSERYVWFLAHTQTKQEQIELFVIDNQTAEVIYTQTHEYSTDHWLGGLKGRTAFGSLLFCPTDNGIISFNVETSLEKTYHDTDSYVGANSHLFLSQNGLLVLNTKQIWNLNLK